jgi:hypothetical protein
MNQAREAGDLVGAWLRPGRVHTAKDATAHIPWLVQELRAAGVRLAGVRLDAGFPSAALLDVLEEHGIPYVARGRNNSALDRLVGPVHLLPWLHGLVREPAAARRSASPARSATATGEEHEHR